MDVTRFQREGGFGLIETMIAIMVLMIFILSIGNFLSSTSETTGQANLETTADGLARQQLAYWQQQLAADTADDFPMPIPCAITNGGGQTSTTSYCSGQNVLNAAGGATTGPYQEYSYCGPVGNQAAAPVCGAPGAAQAALAATDYTVTTSVSWQCDPGSYTETGGMASKPYLYINVQVTWPHMAGMSPQQNSALPAGNTVSPVSTSTEVTPPNGVVFDAYGSLDWSEPNQAGPSGGKPAQSPETAGIPSYASGTDSNTANNTCVNTS